jgi:4'-phosphopantetheinyl transferase
MNIRIADREVHLWMARTDRLDDSARQFCLSVLDGHERARLEKFRVEHARIGFLCAHALLRVALSHYAEVEPRAWRFSRGEYGKPEIAGPVRGVRFNLSHTEGLAVCAIANDEVGVDAEKLARSVDVMRIAEGYYSSAELRALRALSIEDRQQRFLELWTLKEALAKGLGLGLGIELDQFCFAVEDGQTYPKHPTLADDCGMIAPDWAFTLTRFFDSHFIAVAMRNLECVVTHLDALVGQMRPSDL